MKHTMFSRTGTRLAVAAPLAAVAALLPLPSFASATPGDVDMLCGDFVAQRPELQENIVRDIRSYRGAGFVPASSGAEVASLVAACQNDLGSPVSRYVGR